MWVHALAKSALPPALVFPYMELGKSVLDPKEALSSGLVHDLVPTLTEAFDLAHKKLEVYNSVPKLAREDAKAKGRAQILKEITPESLQAVYESISGNEFQLKAQSILASLKKA